MVLVDGRVISFTFINQLTMKRKLKIVLLLIMLSLCGIVVFQAYWSFNAYKQNKKIVDARMDAAMQQALDSCKRDYFDSIRTVLVRRLSDTTTIIKIDSVSEPEVGFFGRHSNYRNDTVNKPISIWISFHGATRSKGFETDLLTFNHYRQILGSKSTTPQIITEMSFYDPLLMTSILDDLGIYDGMQEYLTYIKDHPKATRPPDTWFYEIKGIYKLPPNYRQVDSLKISNYLKGLLDKMKMRVDFKVQLSDKPTPAKATGSFQSESNEYKYQYHGFTFLLTHYTLQYKTTFYARAIFRNPQYVIMRGMAVTLVLSVLLILFTIYSFYYIVRIINQQKALGELKDDFINNMTHELKTPIATITVAIEAMQKYNALNDPEKTSRYLETSRRELNRLNDLVGKVLDVAAFENREVKLIKEKMNVDELVNEVMAIEQSKTDKTIAISYHNDGIADMVADKLHLKNVLFNLLDNAVKYSNDPVEIKIEVAQKASMAVFIIKDNGMGIPAAHVNRVFDKFYRVPTGNVHNVKGTGLGLNYVKYIVDAHGGSISLKSELGEGSEFTVMIPLQNG
jgi:signal transduction histidine kinase